MQAGEVGPDAIRILYWYGTHRAREDNVTYTIETIRPQDDADTEALIRTCLKEFGADHEGTAWADPFLGRLCEVYAEPGSRYWVARDETGQVVGGVGIGPVAGDDDTCELQKMYCLGRVRGTGLAHRLLDLALDFAGSHYSRCYLETLEEMVGARRFYEKRGFVRTDEVLGDPGHFCCDIRYIKELR